MNNEFTNATYKVIGANVDYVKGFVAKTKRINPNTNISAKWIVRNRNQECLTIVSSTPLENLILPEGYYGDALGKFIFTETENEFNKKMKGDFLNYRIKKNEFINFINELRKINPNCEIYYKYDNENYIGKINSTIELKDLNFPNGYYDSIGIDKNGFVGYLNDRIINYKIENEINDVDLSEQFNEVTQRYFDNCSYELINNNENDLVEDYDEIIDNELIQNDQSIKQQPISFEQNLKENYKKTVMNEKIKQTKVLNDNKKFTIIQREKAISDEQKIRNKSAIMAGLCILGAVGSVNFNEQDINAVLKSELNSIYHWKAIGHYLQNLSPLTTLLTAGAGNFIAKYLKYSKKIKQAQNDFIDFNTSLENNQTLGGNENAKSK